MTADRAAYALDREGGERLRFSDAEFLVKADASTTSGAFSIVEEIAPLDTPRHMHANEDELFYVLEVEHGFEVASESFAVGPRAAEQDGTIGPEAYAAASERYGITWL